MCEEEQGELGIAGLGEQHGEERLREGDSGGQQRTLQRSSSADRRETWLCAVGWWGQGERL